MDERQRTHINLLLIDEVERTRRQFVERRTTIYQTSAAAGRLQSGGTIKLVIRAMEELAEQFVNQVSEKVSAIAAEPEAFQTLVIKVNALLATFEGELPEVVRMAGGGGPRQESITKGAGDRFSEAKQMILRKLAILEVSFGPSGRLASKVASAPLAKGGRPLAQHWDDMWAATAVALFTGDLNPKSQADIETAMLTWLEANGFAAANSTVRGRARRLWDRLQAER